MPTLTDNIVAGPAGHVQAAPAASFVVGGSGSVVPGLPGHVEITLATQEYHIHSATTDFHVDDATQGFISPDVTQGIIPEIRVGGIVFHTV